LRASRHQLDQGWFIPRCGSGEHVDVWKRSTANLFRLVGGYSVDTQQVFGQPIAPVGVVRLGRHRQDVAHRAVLLGNSAYLLAGFAPTRRKRLDDGLIDVRILETGRSLSKLRVMTSIMFGRLARSPLYHEHHIAEFSFTSLDGPTAVARDGEVDGLHEHATFSVRHRALKVFRPPPR